MLLYSYKLATFNATYCPLLKSSMLNLEGYPSSPEYETGGFSNLS